MVPGSATRCPAQFFAGRFRRQSALLMRALHARPSRGVAAALVGLASAVTRIEPPAGRQPRRGVDGGDDLPRKCWSSPPGSVGRRSRHRVRLQPAGAAGARADPRHRACRAQLPYAANCLRQTEEGTFLCRQQPARKPASIPVPTSPPRAPRAAGGARAAGPWRTSPSCGRIAGSAAHPDAGRPAPSASSRRIIPARSLLPATAG